MKTPTQWWDQFLPQGLLTTKPIIAAIQQDAHTEGRLAMLEILQKKAQAAHSLIEFQNEIEGLIQIIKAKAGKG